MVRISKISRFLAAAVLFFAVLLVACGPKATATEIPTAPATEVATENSTPTVSPLSGKIVVWIGEGNLSFYQQVGADFTAQTGVVVEMIPYTGVLANDKLALEGPAGTGPDVIQMGDSGLGKAVEQGLFLSLPQDQMDLGSFNPSVIEGYKYKGELYGMPIGQEVAAILYNKALLTSVPDNFKDFITAMTALNDPANGKYGFLMDTTNFYFVYSFMNAYGGYIFKSTDAGMDVSDIGLANAGSVQGVEFVKSLITSGLIPKDMGWDVMEGMFRDGKAAAILDGPWAVGGFTSAGVDVGIASIPTMDNGVYPAAFSGSYGLAVSAFSTKQPEAIAFIQFATNKANTLGFFEFSQKLPPRLDCLNEPAVQKDPLAKGFAQQILHSVTIPNIPEMETVWGPAIDGLTVIMKQDGAVQDTLTVSVGKIVDAIAVLHK